MHGWDVLLQTEPFPHTEQVSLLQPQSRAEVVLPVPHIADVGELVAAGGEVLLHHTVFAQVGSGQRALLLVVVGSNGELALLTPAGRVGEHGIYKAGEPSHRQDV